MTVRRYLEDCTLAALLQGHRFLVLKAKAKITYRPRWKHAGGAVAALYFLWPIVRRVLPAVVPAVTVTATVWFFTAMAVGASGYGAKTAAGSPVDAQQPDGGEPAEERQEPPAEATLYALIRHVAALSDQGTAAHLPDLLTEGHKRGLFGGWQQTDLKAHLTALGAPLVDGKKLTFNGHQRNRQAVLLDGLPPAAPAPVPALTRQPAPGTAAGTAAGGAGRASSPAPPAASGVPSGATGSR
ncbi:hypothetical protein GXW83_27400 [Streptacidiphilus sp. PB12-B1b]|uniref:hypothetical protein n=1 Tax=Streptacidiphilus sp. PB12-B1b TaxID=2705012 RepID=UPI0015F94DEB|nr:hypothetical protein [Streptacidiphilus sp. PB12-B1b]QMU78872.1 hypothetical protein GXW83_27400 [Streptacidiphilus sp. PB12-B1b]